MIKEGRGDELWNDEPNKKTTQRCRCTMDKPACRQAGKNDETFYGYKNHAKVDTKSKFIDKYKVTDASVHDSQVLDDLLTPQDNGQNSEKNCKKLQNK